MKTKTYKIALCAILLLSGCSKMNDTAKKEGNMPTTEQYPSNDMEKKTEDTIDSMMAYLKEKGIEWEQEANIDQMEFAAHEGRSFMVNGQKAYLYRMNSEDASMKQVLEDATNKGKVKVNIDGEEKEYQAQVKNDYLLVYENGEGLNDLMMNFPNYSNGMASQNPNENGNATTPNDTNVPETNK